MTEANTIQIPVSLLRGGEMAEGKAVVGEPVTVTVRGVLLSEADGLATIELETSTEAEEPMSERERVRGLGESADMEDF